MSKKIFVYIFFWCATMKLINIFFRWQICLFLFLASSSFSYYFSSFLLSIFKWKKVLFLHFDFIVLVKCGSYNSFNFFVGLDKLNNQVLCGVGQTKKLIFVWVSFLSSQKIIWNFVCIWWWREKCVIFDKTHSCIIFLIYNYGVNKMWRICWILVASMNMYFNIGLGQFLWGDFEEDGVRILGFCWRRAMSCKNAFLYDVLRGMETLMRGNIKEIILD